MARKGRQDRGLLSKKDATGKTVWFVRLYHEGRERRFGSFTTKTDARKFYEKAKRKQEKGRFFPERYQCRGYQPVQEAIDAYMLTTTTKRDQAGNRYFARWWGHRFAGKRLNAITTEALDQARQELLAKGRTPQTVNRYMEWLRHFLNLVVRDGKLPCNPATKVKMFKEPSGKTRFLSPDEEAALMKAIGPTYAPWMRLAILTGMRREEQFSLRWEHVDCDHGLLTLPNTKAGGVQYVRLNEEAKAILRGIDTWQRSVWVFPSENPRTHMDAKNFYSRVWMPAVKKAGIESATWHDLRHTYASRLAMSGQTEGTIATLLRQSTTALVRRYAHLSPSHLQAAVEGLSSFGTSPTTPTERQAQPEHRDTISTPTVTKTGIVDEETKAGIA